MGFIIALVITALLALVAVAVAADVRCFVRVVVPTVGIAVPRLSAQVANALALQLDLAR